MSSGNEPAAEPSPSAAPARARVVLLVIAGGADPVGATSSPHVTPLQEAGTPAFDRVARDGHVGRVVLDAVSCWDGFTGLLGAPSRSAALGASEWTSARSSTAEPDTASGGGVDGSPEPRWAARVDLVTADDQRVLDPFGGRVADPEASALFDGVAGALPHGRLVRLPGRRGLWLSTEPIADAPPPWGVGDRAPRSVLGADADLLALYETSRRALGAHDVNAVRVDLGENPANALWPHGAGELPLRMEQPSWALGRTVALVAGGGPAAGVAAALSWDAVPVDGDDDALCAAALDALATHDVVVVRTRSVWNAGIRNPDTAHPARVEAFSAVDARLASPLLSALEERGPFVFAVAADGAVDSAARTFSAEPVPCGVLSGGGALAAHGHGLTAYHERVCADSGARLDGAAAFAALLQHELDALG